MQRSGCACTPCPSARPGVAKGKGRQDRWGITRPARSEAKEGWGNRPGVPTNGRLYPCPARGAGPLRKSGKADGNDVVARACGRAMSLTRSSTRGLGRKQEPGDFSDVRPRTSLPTDLSSREGSSPAWAGTGAFCWPGAARHRARSARCEVMGLTRPSPAAIVPEAGTPPTAAGGPVSSRNRQNGPSVNQARSSANHARCA